jgi:hypothetical protein
MAMDADRAGKPTPRIALTISAGGDLFRDFKENAGFRGKSIRQFLRMAPAAVRRGFEAMKIPGGHVVLRGRGRLLIFQPGSLDEFRKHPSMKMCEGITVGDLGGVPLEGLITIRLDGEEVEALRVAAGAASPGEAAGYAVWVWNRWHNTWREDFPGHELGIYLEREGRFESL